MKEFEYLEPTTVSEACGLLRRYDGEARVYAGGAYLSIVMKQGFLQPKALVNIKGIKELKGIHFDPAAGLTLGALVTHHELETSEVARERLPILREVEREVANIRVRNVATVGGNLASGEPLTDLPQVFISLDARVKISGPSGERVIRLDELFVDYYQTSLADDEILTHVVVPPLPARSGIEYIRFSSSSVIDKPCVGVAIRITLEPGSEACKDVRVVLGCVAPTPLRARKAEEILEGNPLTAELAARAAASAGEECSPTSDLRGSAEYKRGVVRALVKRAALQAYERALQEGDSPSR